MTDDGGRKRCMTGWEDWEDWEDRRSPQRDKMGVEVADLK